MIVFKGVYVCVKAKLTLASFFYFFSMHLSLKLLTYSPFSDRPTRQQHVLLPTSWHLYLHSATGRQPFFIVIELEDYKAYHFQRCLIPLRILLDRCRFHLDQPYRPGPR